MAKLSPKALRFASEALALVVRGDVRGPEMSSGLRAWDNERAVEFVRGVGLRQDGYAEVPESFARGYANAIAAVLLELDHSGSAAKVFDDPNDKYYLSQIARDLRGYS